MGLRAVNYNEVAEDIFDGFNEVLDEGLDRAIAEMEAQVRYYKKLKRSNAQKPRKLSGSVPMDVGMGRVFGQNINKDTHGVYVIWGWIDGKYQVVYVGEGKLKGRWNEHKSTFKNCIKKGGDGRNRSTVAVLMSKESRRLEDWYYEFYPTHYKRLGEIMETLLYYWYDGPCFTPESSLKKTYSAAQWKDINR